MCASAYLGACAKDGGETTGNIEFDLARREMSYRLRERMGFGPARHVENIAQTVMENQQSSNSEHQIYRQPNK